MIDDESRKSRPKHRRIRAISIAPALVTLGNLLSGFAAIHFAARPEFVFKNPTLIHWLPTNLALACYFVFLAMVCDALDGRLARFARTTSDFGGQLDSLADVVSFGVAPAFIMIRLVMNVFTFIPAGAIDDTIVGPVAGTAFGRFCWIAGGAYLACGAMRLARFNTENVPDESAHMAFKGLPIPGAAGALISMVLLNKNVIPTIEPFLAGSSELFAKVIPWVAIALGLLMVSRLPYIHLVNRFLRGKKPFGMLVAVVLIVLGFLLWPHVMLTVGLCGYAASGPVNWLVTRWRRRDVLATDHTDEH